MSINRQRRKVLTLGTGAGLALLAAGWATADESKVVRIGYQKFNTLNILKGSGNLERALQSRGIKVQWHEFLAGPQLLEALNAGGIDFGHAADSPSVFAQAANAATVYLAAEPPYPEGIAILVQRQSPIQAVRDLKGKKVAIGRGWNVQYLLVRALEEAGITYEDIQPVYVTNAADARAAFESGKVDAVGLWDPFLAGAELGSETRVLRDGSGLSNNRTFYHAAPKFAASEPDIIRAIFAELKKTESWAQNHPQEVAALLAPQLGIDPKVLLRTTERRKYGVVPVDAGIVAEQQKLADTFFGLKLIPRQIAAKDAVFKQVLL